MCLCVLIYVCLHLARFECNVRLRIHQIMNPSIYFIVFQWQKIFSLGIWSPNSTKLWGILSHLLFSGLFAIFSACLPFLLFSFYIHTQDSMFLTIYNCIVLLALIFPPLWDSLPNRRSCATYFLNIHVILSESPFQENPGSENYPVKRYFEEIKRKLKRFGQLVELLWFWALFHHRSQI